MVAALCEQSVFESELLSDCELLSDMRTPPGETRNVLVEGDGGRRITDDLRMKDPKGFRCCIMAESKHSRTNQGLREFNGAGREAELQIVVIGSVKLRPISRPVCGTVLTESARLCLAKLQFRA